MRMTKKYSVQWSLLVPATRYKKIVYIKTRVINGVYVYVRVCNKAGTQVTQQCISISLQRGRVCPLLLACAQAPKVGHREKRMES